MTYVYKRSSKLFYMKIRKEIRQDFQTQRVQRRKVNDWNKANNAMAPELYRIIKQLNKKKEVKSRISK